jgi:EF hand
MKLTIAMAALGIAALSGAAEAGWRGGGAGLMERYDGNGDGKITQDEIDANRAGWHKDFDKDKSGELSIGEFEALWLKARREAMVREYQSFDRDGDGKVTVEEYQSPMKSTVADMDKNGDGALSREKAMEPKAQ